MVEVIFGWAGVGIAMKNLLSLHIGTRPIHQCTILRIFLWHIYYSLCIACRHYPACLRAAQTLGHSLVDHQVRDNYSHMSNIFFRQILYYNVSWMRPVESIFDLVQFLVLEMIAASERFHHLITLKNWPGFLRTTSEIMFKVLSSWARTVGHRVLLRI